MTPSRSRVKHANFFLSKEVKSLRYNASTSDDSSVPLFNITVTPLGGKPMGIRISSLQGNNNKNNNSINKNIKEDKGNTSSHATLGVSSIGGKASNGSSTVEIDINADEKQQSISIKNINEEESADTDASGMLSDYFQGTSGSGAEEMINQNQDSDSNDDTSSRPVNEAAPPSVVDSSSGNIQCRLSVKVKDRLYDMRKVNNWIPKNASRRTLFLSCNYLLRFHYRLTGHSYIGICFRH